MVRFSLAGRLRVRMVLEEYKMVQLAWLVD